MLQRLLARPETAELDVDGPDRPAVRAAVLERKPLLAAVVRECHELTLSLDRDTFGQTPARVSTTANTRASRCMRPGTRSRRQ